MSGSRDHECWEVLEWIGGSELISVADPSQYVNRDMQTEMSLQI
jgi:hypothetical protein